ncbi:MAG: response regulator [Deltaproteobacteria bacterium]|nr:response regulator [Deltaproteobacteria bacterium]
MSLTIYKVVVFSTDSFDVLGFRRALKKASIHCETVFISAYEELEQIIHQENRETFDLALVEYGENIEDSCRAAQLLVGETDLPIIGIFMPDSFETIARELSEGITSYVVQSQKGEHFDVLSVLIRNNVRSQTDVVKFDRFREQIAMLKREQHALLNSSLTLISYHQPDTRIIWSNAYEEEGEVSSYDYLAGRLCKEIWKNGGIPNGKCPVATAVETGESVEAEVTTLDGYTMLQRSYPVKNEDGKVVGVMASTLDMSAVSPAQEAMRTAARIQASATLAGGIAHKFNNLMAGVMGNVSLALQDLTENHPACPLLYEIEQAAHTAGELSEQLLAFARGGKYLPKRINMNEVITEALQTHSRRLPGKIKLDHELTKDLWPIDANQAQMGLLLTQVFNNAVEAIEASDRFQRGEGRISIITTNEQIVDSANSQKPWLRDGRYVCVAIEDNGCGMSAETRQKIFEPFFTTKKKGRGLGLSGAYGIVRSHEGHIFVESEKGRGTTVAIHIPATNVEELPVEPPAKAIAETPRPIVLARGSETVLVVDDEAMLRKAIHRLLKRLGYTVLEASSGDEAVTLAKEYEGPIHITLLDMIMPGLDGMDAYRQLKEQYPTMEVIVMSGYDRETYGDALIDAGAGAFMQKPVPMDRIASEIRRILDDKETPPVPAD